MHVTQFLYKEKQYSHVKHIVYSERLALNSGSYPSLAPSKPDIKPKKMSSDKAAQVRKVVVQHGHRYDPHA